MFKEKNQKKSLLTTSNRFLASAALLLGLTYSAIGHSATIQLDFTTYTQYKSVCSGGSCVNYDYWDNPIISDYQLVLDMSNLTNSAYTDAYNNTDTFTEVVNTSISNFSGTHPDYSSTNASVNQTYSQYESGGSIIGDMRISAGFNDDYGTSYVIDQIYTGNLPPELAPDDSTAIVFENGYTGFNWDNVIGVDPNFIVFDEAGLVALYNSLIGEQFSFYDSKSSYNCADVDIYGNCIGSQTAYVDIYSSGYAILTATTVVPIPAAFWLFGSGLIGLIGIARRKKS